MMKRQQTIVTALSILIMILLLLISRRIWTRIDLSSNKAYTLAPVSKNLRNEITGTVNITYYCTGKLAAMYPLPGEITDLLREYAARSRGTIRFTLRDPVKDYAGDISRFGLTPQTLPDAGEGELSLATVYSGVVIEYLNKTEVLPWVFALDTLEYDVTSRIRALVSGKKREIGIIASDPQKNLADFYNFLNQVLNESGYSVLFLNPGDEIPDTLPALFVMGGVETLDEYSLYRIDRYIQLGGRVLFAAESVDVDFTYTWDARLMEDKGLLAMIACYGAEFEKALAMDRASLVIPYRDPTTGQYQQTRYPPWIVILPENVNRESTLTSGSAEADLFWASPLALRPPQGVKAEALFNTTPEAWRMTRDFTVKPEMSYLFGSEEAATKGTVVLAASLEGAFPSFFAGKPKPESPDDLPELPGMPDEVKESRIVVIGDSDLAGSIFIQFTQSRRNLDFLVKAADWLGSDEDIAGIRNRTGGGGRLDRITDPVKKQGAITLARLLNLILVPLAVIVFGIFRIVQRRPKTGRGKGAAE
jgi:ABC-type uncharacterized transport system involved in gliding motility auxiliary subunit